MNSNFRVERSRADLAAEGIAEDACSTLFGHAQKTLVFTSLYTSLALAALNTGAHTLVVILVWVQDGPLPRAPGRLSFNPIGWNWVTGSYSVNHHEGSRDAKMYLEPSGAFVTGPEVRAGSVYKTEGRLPSAWRHAVHVWPSCAPVLLSRMYKSWQWSSGDSGAMFYQQSEQTQLAPSLLPVSPKVLAL